MNTFYRVWSMTFPHERDTARIEISNGSSDEDNVICDEILFSDKCSRYFPFFYFFDMSALTKWSDRAGTVAFQWTVLLLFPMETIQWQRWCWCWWWLDNYDKTNRFNNFQCKNTSGVTIYTIIVLIFVPCLPVLICAWNEIGKRTQSPIEILQLQ